MIGYWLLVTVNTNAVGDTSVEELSNVYMEVATLAFRLDKPLSCRYLTLPYIYMRSI